MADNCTCEIKRAHAPDEESLETPEATAHVAAALPQHGTAAGDLPAALLSSSFGHALLRDGRVVAANAAWRALDGDGGSLLWCSGDGAGGGLGDLAQRVARSLDGDVPPVACRFRSPCGERFVELHCERVMLAEGPAVLAIAHDTTQAEAGAESAREVARASAIKRERMHAAGELASGLAHDLNNALNVMVLRLRRLRGDERCMEAQGPSIDVLARVVDEVATLVGRLQDFTRRRCDTPRERADLRSVLADAVSQACAACGPGAARPFLVELDVPPLPAVRGAAAELRAVFSDLLQNAREAMAAGGTVRVSARDDGRQVTVTVADEGPGIAPEHLPRLFEPFFTTKGPRGTGLGLSTAWSVLTRLGGSIEAANGAHGGAVLTLAFPHALAETAPAPATAPAASDRVLVVDDDRDNLEALQMALEDEGFSVDVAESGPDALGLLERGARYGLVLCDVGMPRMNGWQVAEAIREMAPGTRIWMLTGWAREIPDTDPRRAFVEGVLGKPADLGLIKELLQPAPAH